MERRTLHPEAYTEHPGTAVDHGEFSHVMALALNPRHNQEGVIRCITDRTGNVDQAGYIDKSALYKVNATQGLEKFQIAEPLDIQGKDEIIQNLVRDDEEFIGLEDPDIVLDPETNLLHLYFTIPLLNKSGTGHRIHLGHALGETLDTLTMTEPVLSPTIENPVGAKELSLAPVNAQGIRLNLVESSDEIDGIGYSTVRVGIAKDLGSAWKFGDVVIHPKFDGKPWCAEHASPGPLLPEEFISVGKGKRLGILNGREASTIIDTKTQYGMFSVGLFIYDYEHGKVDWISDTPLIIDSEASTITFGSEFIQIDKGMGLLYAHVDDSFVRAYTLKADILKTLLP
jgi:hypothetical protein